MSLLHKLPSTSNIDVLGFDSKLFKESAEIIINDITDFINMSIVTNEVIND